HQACGIRARSGRHRHEPGGCRALVAHSRHDRKPAALCTAIFRARPLRAHGSTAISPAREATRAIQASFGRRSLGWAIAARGRTSKEGGGVGRAETMINSQEVFRTTPGAMAALTPEAVILDVNDEYVEVSGRSREQLLGRNLFDVFPRNPDDPAELGP